MPVLALLFVKLDFNSGLNFRYGQKIAKYYVSVFARFVSTYKFLIRYCSLYHFNEVYTCSLFILKFAFYLVVLQFFLLYNVEYFSPSRLLLTFPFRSEIVLERLPQDHFSICCTQFLNFNEGCFIMLTNYGGISLPHPEYINNESGIIIVLPLNSRQEE